MSDMKYRYLGDSGLLVSRICLGTMTFEMPGWGCDEATSAAIVDRYIEAGGNFIDTADMYAAGVSEQVVGRSLKHHNRDDIVLATKAYFRTGETPNAKGTSRKHLIEACQASLKRLDTDYIDLYQVHGPDPYTPLEETMRTLDDLVRQGLVRYIGCSNYFGWQIVKANAISDRQGLVKFCSGQHMYNMIRRDVEREVLPACDDQGLGLICWSPLASGFLTGKYTDREKPAEGSRIAQRASIDLPRYWHDAGFAIVDALNAASKQLGQSSAQIALAWLLHDRRVTAVIIGATSIEQLESNLVPGAWNLPDEQYDQLTEAAAFDGGYPLEWQRQTYPGQFGGAEFEPKFKALL